MWRWIFCYSSIFSVFDLIKKDRFIVRGWMGEVKDIKVYMMWKEPAPDGLALRRVVLVLGYLDSDWSSAMAVLYLKTV